MTSSPAGTISESPSVVCTIVSFSNTPGYVICVDLTVVVVTTVVVVVVIVLPLESVFVCTVAPCSSACPAEMVGTAVVLGFGLVSVVVVSLPPYAESLVSSGARLF